MIHEESIGYLAALTVTWPTVYWLERALRHRIGCDFAKVSQPMGRSQESAARSAARPWSSDLFTSSVVFVCVFARKIEVCHDNNMHHALCTHTRIFPFQIELHRADWIFLLCIKDKNTPLSFSAHTACLWVRPTHHHSLLLFFSQVHLFLC